MLILILIESSFWLLKRCRWSKSLLLLWFQPPCNTPTLAKCVVPPAPLMLFGKAWV